MSPDMRPFLNITKALADETRLRILMALRSDELCICQIVALLKMAPSTVSRHVYLLSQAGLIDKRKCGKWIYCRLPGSGASAVVTAALTMTVKALTGAAPILRDVDRLAEIKTLSLEDLCFPMNQKRSRKAKR